MAHENEGGKIPLGYVVPDRVPDELLAASNADRGLAFAAIEFHARRLGFDLTARGRSEELATFYELPLGVSSVRRVVVARTYEAIGTSMLRVYVNDKVPHPMSGLDDVRRLHMTGFAASLLGKRIVRSRSSADSVGSTGALHSNGKSVDGPRIVYNRELGVVELLGSASHILTQLLPIGTKLPPDQEGFRSAHSVTLAGVLGTIEPERHIVDAEVWLPATPDAKL